MLEGAVLAVVAADQAACERIAGLLRAAHANVSSAIVNVNALATLSAPGFDAIVLHIDGDPERFSPLVASIREDARTRSTALVGVVDGGLAAIRLAPLALSRVVTSPVGDTFPEIIATVLEVRRNELAAAVAARVSEERQRAALDRLAAMRSDAQALTHDARGLCGVVLGFAANLRDGLLGPLDEHQQSHVREIIAAAHDMAAMLDRFGGGVRAQPAILAQPASPPNGGRRVTRRTLLDLSEVARSITRAFASAAEEKRVTLALDAQDPVSLWADNLQIRQVIVNLLVNALKFTPAGGRVMLGVRHVAPAQGAAGIASRTHAELVVRDTGPGISVAQWERILAPDGGPMRAEAAAESGLGLAVVRDIVRAHGGSIRLEDTPGGGATFVVNLRLDMRARRESLVLVDDPEAGRRVVAALEELRNPAVEPARSPGGAVSDALSGCRAVVVVPRATSGALSELLSASQPPDGPRQ